MSTSRAFRDAAHLAGSNLARIRLASSTSTSATRPFTTATSALRRHHHVHNASSHALRQQQQRAGYASISTNSTPSPARLDQTAGLTPGARAIIATARGVRNILLFATSSLALTYFVYAGAHAYLEQYKCPSPAGLSTEVQRCLHGAWVREEISPDPDVAELYLQKAIEMARKDLETHYAKKYKDAGADVEQLSFLEIEKDKALVEIQNRLARFFGRIGRDEQAATVWTRLWKLSEKENNSLRPSSKESTSGLGFGSLFGGSAERPLIVQKDGIPFAKSAADCWMRMGEYEMAEEALAWTLGTLASTTPTGSAAGSGSTTTASTRIEEIGLFSTLGALYVRQAKFEYALSLFVKALQAVQEHRAASTAGANNGADEKSAKENNDMWYCREAILTQSIGETLYGAATRSPTPSTVAATTPTTPATETKKSSSWKFWSSSSSSSTPSSSTTTKAVPQQKSPEQIQKEEEALGWMQKALTMAKAKSGEHRDCDECAALGLNNLGLINEMEGKKGVALAQFKEAVLHATMAKDYVGIEDYNRNIARLTDQMHDVDSETASSTTSPIPA